MGVDRRQFLAGTFGVAGAALLAACSGDGDDPAAPTSTTAGRDGAPDGGRPLVAPGSRGLVDEATYQQRVDEYLAFATEELHPDNPTGIAVHLVRAHREPEYSWDIDQVTVESLQPVWDQIDGWLDTRDFNLMYLHWVLELGQGDRPATTLSAEVIDAIGQRMRDNRYRYDDPLPADRIDDQWFWSENHVIIGLVNEYLAGRRFADATFEVTGLTGAEHAERSRPRILEWIDERARFGFFEWHSNVYMLKNITPLVTLAELADDAELVRAAGMALDLCLLDMAAPPPCRDVHRDTGADLQEGQDDRPPRGHLRHGQVRVRRHAGALPVADRHRRHLLLRSRQHTARRRRWSTSRRRRHRGSCASATASSWTGRRR